MKKPNIDRSNAQLRAMGSVFVDAAMTTAGVAVSPEMAQALADDLLGALTFAYLIRMLQVWGKLTGTIRGDNIAVWGMSITDVEEPPAA